MKAIYYNIFGLGHINPTLPLVHALTHSGVDIIYHTSPERRELVEAQGAKFSNYGYDDYKASDFNPGKSFVLQTIPATLGLLPFLMKEIERVKPDFILYDSMAPWGYALAQIFKIPSFCIVTTFALSEKNKKAMFDSNNIVIDKVNLAAIERLKHDYGVELSLSDTLGAYGRYNIVLTSKDFNPPVENQDSKEFFYSGVMLKQNDTKIEIDKTKKIIAMAFGTLALKEDPSLLRFHQMLIDSFRDDPDYLLILSAGTDENCKLLENSASNVLIFSQIPQFEILSFSSCFIGHGGMNSVNEALFNKVPMIVIPLAHDQYGNAKRIEELHLGKVLFKEGLSAKILKQAVLDIMNNEGIASNLREMQESFKKCKGLDGVLDYIRFNLLV